MKQMKSLLENPHGFSVSLVFDGLLVGIFAGCISVIYRLLLNNAEKLLFTIIAFTKTRPFWIAVWFIVLIVMGLIVGWLMSWEGMASGSGIPQVQGEMKGYLNQNWHYVLCSKIIGGTLCILGGLSLGREGPSVQLGAMVAKGIAKITKKSQTKERYMMTCGAGAGLAAAFNAPLAGVMFSLEEIHKNFSVSVLISVMTASITADYISAEFMGFRPVFQFEVTGAIPDSYYGHIIALGIILGIMGAFYNKVTLKSQELFGKIKGKRSETIKLLIPFLMAGFFGFTMPEILGSGHNLVDMVAEGNMMLKGILFLFVMKLFFSCVSFGSGAPGGIFFPLLVLGSLIGGAYASFAVTYLGMDSQYISNFIVLAMAGYFTAIVRAPITGIILIFEMTGSFSQMLSLSLVSIVAYLVATAFKSEPIYESLLTNLLKKRGIKVSKKTGEKVLQEYIVSYGCEIQNKMIQQVEWPKNCLLVAIKRSGSELIPKGHTILMNGDTIVTMTDESDASSVHDRMEVLCKEQEKLK